MSNIPEPVEQTTREPALLALTMLAAVVITGWAPVADRMTWFLESVPVMAALPLLLLTYRRFPFTVLSYRLMWVFALVLLIGGHYSYAEMPLFDWLQENFDLQRNYYDRLGHIMQGVAPAIIAREILLRTSPVGRGGWLFFLVCCVTLALSASYEFIEWWVAEASGEAATAFLATQGDPWDTQWDMFLALCGAIVSLLLFERTHNRHLAALDPTLLYRK